MNYIFPILVLAFFTAVFVLYSLGCVRKHIFISALFSEMIYFVLSLFDLRLIFQISVCFFAYICCEAVILKLLPLKKKKAHFVIVVSEFNNGHGKVMSCGKISDAVCLSENPPIVGSVVSAFDGKCKICFTDLKEG